MKLRLYIAPPEQFVIGTYTRAKPVYIIFRTAYTESEFQYPAGNSERNGCTARGIHGTLRDSRRTMSYKKEKKE